MKNTANTAMRAHGMTGRRPALPIAPSSVLVLLLLLLAGGNAAAEPRERVYARAGVMHLAPLVDSGEIVLSDVRGTASLAIDNGPIAGSGADMDSVTMPAVIVGYILPVWDGRVAVETILALPPTIRLRNSGTIASESLAPYALGNIPTGVPPLGEELGETKALPPVVTAVYRFRHRQAIRPYLGAGLSILIAYDSKITNPLLLEVVEPELEIDPALGLVGQAGVEARFLRRFFATLDIKYIAGLEVSSTVKGIHVNTPALSLYESVRVGNASVDVAVNPLIVQAGVGMNF